MLRSPCDPQYDTITLRAAHDRSHSVGIDGQRPNHPLRSAPSALCARGCEIRDEKLAEPSTSCVSIDSTRVARTLTTAARLVRFSRSKAHSRSFSLPDKNVVT